MPDEIDEAQEREEFYRTMLLKKALEKINEEDPLIINGRRHCLDCEQPIPKKRLRANPEARRCIFCQTRKERLG